jgi:hypothetical protein
VAFGAFGFFFAIDQGLELMMALLADIFVNGHGRLQYLLESICGDFANLKN